MADLVVTGLEPIREHLGKALSAHRRAQERDYTGNNPKGIDRDFEAQRVAKQALDYWEWALSAAVRAAEARTPFEVRIMQGGYKLAFLAGPDGKEWPVSAESFDGRLAALADPVSYAAFLEAHEAALRAEPVKLGELCAMLPGARKRSFKAALLDRNGYADEGGLTAAGQTSGYFTERSGTFGPYSLLTPAGLSWAYRQYLDGHVPLSAGRVPQAVPEFEDRIAKSAEDRLRASAGGSRRPQPA